jgi:hypothetical protein
VKKRKKPDMLSAWPTCPGMSDNNKNGRDVSQEIKMKNKQEKENKRLKHTELKVFRFSYLRNPSI